jgi:hypothetical protein
MLGSESVVVIVGCETSRLARATRIYKDLSSMPEG